ncbi:GNAT family N-acetyltransferase [Vibrio parahaemolyticus]|uniref:GNAT family N-acetyltransferase n=1 Tax=Vibrio parahaemolyticus TaxID=670 RepID=UPI001EECED0D|nr:GNAT family N-acetyltransferase [Vibrio parahaemolyticus]MCG6442291.1 GNAT family N-acetyltransferase [Vibrio parahaemolyticus]MCG6455627.1 GNAT family N-acetyltransferase [Vibrio parahaemolyticus]
MLELRKSVIEDAGAFVEMEHSDDTKDFIIPYSLEQHRILIDSNDVIYLSLYYENELSGFMILSQDNQDVVEFRRIVVASKGKGFGQLAIKAMERYCAEKLNCSRVWLDVFELNSRGLHIYQKLGYTQFKEAFYEGKKLLFMEKTF